MTRKIHDTDYLFLTTRVRALEGCLLNRGQMEQMLEAGSPEEAARILTDCGYPELETVSAITVGEMLNKYPSLISYISPTHMGRTHDLFLQGIEFARMGGMIDIST